MDFFSPPLIALYIILGAFVVVYLYFVVVGSRMHNLSMIQSPYPDSFEDKRKKQVPEPTVMKPLYPQRVTIGGYDIKPQPHTLDVSNELVKTTVRKSCTIEPKCCSF